MNIAEIAKRTGVSSAAVSRYFNDGYISEEKRGKIRKVVEGVLSGCCCVYHDDYHASYDLTKYLLKIGRKKLAYLGSIRQDKAVGEERYRGFQDALQDEGLGEFAPNYVISAFTVDSGYEKTGELLEKYGELAAGMLMEILHQGGTDLKKI